MFHVVVEGSVPEYLVSDWRDAPTQVVCGAGVGQRREAIPYKKFNQYANDGKLRVKNMCSACGRKLGFKIKRGDAE